MSGSRPTAGDGRTGAGRGGRAQRDRGARYALLAMAAWTGLTAVAVLAELGRARAAVRDAAEVQARQAFELLLVTRRWNAGHGGVFVPVGPTLRPNPWLSHVPDRSARTAAGRELTLMNPAWMTREILELVNRDLRFTGHLTSLRPLRPENAPDPWERRALERLEAGEAEVGELIGPPGQERLRFMGRLLVEERCLGCHQAQGYRVGDLRGGISVSVPLAPLLEVGIADTRRQFLVHGTIWLLGLGGIAVALRDHRRRAAAEAAAEARKARAEAELAAARRLEAVGRLSAGLAHDFNNLLAPILTVSGLVRAELAPGSPLREDLEEIQSAAQKARELVRGLQTLSRKNGARLERIALGALAVESEELLRRFAGSRFTFALRVAEAAPAVLADRPLLELALANLVVNAREGAVKGREIAMEVGAANLSEAEAERLHVRAGRHAAVTVAAGGALPAADSGFVPVQGSAGADPGGAGFGLQTVNGIAEQYGGGVVVREAPGAGWIVRLLVPEAPPAPEAAPSPA